MSSSLLATFQVTVQLPSSLTQEDSADTSGWWALAGAAAATAPARPMNAPARTAVVRRSGDFSRFTRTPVVRNRGTAQGGGKRRVLGPETGRRRLPASSAGDRGRLQQAVTIATELNLGNHSGRLKGVVADPRSSLYATAFRRFPASVRRPENSLLSERPGAGEVASTRAKRGPMTRIIAGVHGGRRLSAPAGAQTRPTADRVREAFFSTLTSMVDLDGARFADL